MKNHGNLKWVFGVIPILLWALIGAPAMAAQEKDEDYDFSWLDPDKKIYVLQNRKFLKANHPAISLMGGLGLSGPYVNATVLDPRVSYYFSEAWGAEFLYSFSFTKRSATFDALVQSSSTAIPRIREVRSIMGAVMHWVPWYAKINVFNRILYFDWYFSLGAGQVQTQLDTNTTVGAASTFVDQSFFALLWGTGHQYHLSDQWLVRLDLLGALFQAPLLGNTGENALFSNYQFTFGVGMRL